jgi:primosomal protein N'
MFLFIHPRKGLFSITKCGDCGFVFGCSNCMNESEKPKALTLFSKSQFKFFMGCNQCQTSYVFDQKCPACTKCNFQSMFGGIDELKNVLEENFQLDVTILESGVKSAKESKSKKADISETVGAGLVRPLEPTSEIPESFTNESPPVEAILHRQSEDAVDADSEQQEILRYTLNDSDLDVTASQNSHNDTVQSLQHFKQQAILTTRLFDPTMDYSQFHTIIIVQSQNLLAGTDYLMQEELYKNLCELFLANISSNSKLKTKIIFDTIDPELEFFGNIRELALELGDDSNLEFEIDGGVVENVDEEGFGKVESASAMPLNNSKVENPSHAILQWHQKMSQKESKNRQVFGFPPFYNLLLLTTQEKKKDQALNKIRIAKDLIQSQFKDLEITGVRIGSPYPARFLQRKGMYSYHLLIKFPRQYKDFEELKTIVSNTAFSSRIQVRLNPQHLF